MDKNRNENEVIANLFKNLDNWRRHPKYQLERRVDIFFSLYLKEVLEDKFKSDNGFYIADKLIPEFPVRKGTILEDFKDHQHKNMSYNIDYLTTCKDSKNIIFVELKTEQKSINKNQNNCLKETKEIDFIKILEGIKELCKATEAKGKYYCLLKELQSLGLFSNLEGLDNLIADEGNNGSFPQKKYKELIDNIKINRKAYKTHLVVIQPNTNYYDKPLGIGEVIIIFDDFIKTIEKHDDEISRLFKESLKSWADSEAGLKYSKQ